MTLSTIPINELAEYKKEKHWESSENFKYWLLESNFSPEEGKQDGKIYHDQQHINENREEVVGWKPLATS